MRFGIRDPSITGVDPMMAIRSLLSFSHFVLSPGRKTHWLDTRLVWMVSLLGFLIHDTQYPRTFIKFSKFGIVQRQCLK